MNFPRSLRRLAALPILLLALAAGSLCALLVSATPRRANASSPSTYTCMASPLGAATGYTEFVQNNGTRGSESEGAIAYGGSLSASGMTVGSRLSVAEAFPALVVAGDTTGPFNLQAGSAYVRDTNASINFNGGGARLATDPINFASAFQTIDSNSAQWAQMAANGTAQVIAPGADGTPAMGGSSSLLMSGTDATLDVFAVTPAQLNGSAAIFVKVPTGATALINVTGTGAVTVSGTLEFYNGSAYSQPDNFGETGSNAVTDTVWNFPSASTVRLDNGDAFGGTIVAPNATVDAVSIGHNNGAVIAQNFSSNFETHQYLLPSSACLPQPTTTTTGTTTTGTTTTGTTTTGGGGGTHPPSAELHVTKTASASSVQAGQRVTYTISATNQGQGEADNVVLSDTLPSGMTFVSADSGCSDSGLTVSCQAGTVPAGGATSFNIVAQAQQVSAPVTTSDQLASVVKAEQYITIPADQVQTADLSCGAGMIATDASVEVVHVDQGTGTLEDVQVQRLYQLPDGTYEAIVSNPTSGQAQAEMYVTCMSAVTQQGYPLIVSDQITQAATLNAGTHTVALNCGAGRTPIAPSLDVPAGAATVTSIVPGGADEQNLTVQVTQDNTQIVAGMRCLENQTGVHNGAVEQLSFSPISESVTVPADSSVNVDTSYQLICGDQQKGIVGGWILQPGLQSMGNEPQPKTRVFWIDNPTQQSERATLYLLCVDEHLRQATGAATLTNTASATTSSEQSSGAVLSASATVTVTDQTSGAGSGPGSSGSGTTTGSGTGSGSGGTGSGSGGTGSGSSGSGTGTTAPTQPIITIDAIKAMVGVSHGNVLAVPVHVSAATHATAILELPTAVMYDGKRLKAGFKLAAAPLKTGRSGATRVRLKLSAKARRMLAKKHIRRLRLVVRDQHGRIHRLTVKLKKG